MMDPMCISLVQQHMERTGFTLSDQFRAKYQPKRTNATMSEVVSKWNEEQLVRGLVYQHLRNVAPALSLEFKETYHCSCEPTPGHLVELIIETQRKSQGGDEAQDIQIEKGVSEKSGVPTGEKRQRLGTKQNMFTKEEIMRIESAIADKADIGTLAKQMGRSYPSVHGKISALRKGVGLKKGKFTVEEVNRIRQAIENKEDYKHVATELGRMPVPVLQKMRLLKTNPGPKGKVRGFKVEEDLLILERIVPRLKYLNLSSSGFLSQSDTLELAAEFQRNPETVRGRWERYLQPWILQHFTGTSGFRVERMLTRFVAENFGDYRGIDWSDIVNQHKEFAGHTSTSLRQIYHKVIKLYKEKSAVVSVQEVAAYAEKVYQPGKERRELVSQVARREKAVQHFKMRVKELEINIVI